MTKLVIDRGEWLTGRVANFLGSSLWDASTNLKCCLGMYGEQVERLEKEQMEDKPMLNDIGACPAWMNVTCRLRGTGFTKKIEEALQETNDSNLHPIRKEARIKKLFKHYGNVEVTFVGKYATALKTAGIQRRSR